MILPSLSHLLVMAANPLLLSIRTKLLPLPKNFSLLSFTNLIPFESTYLANDSDINFFRIHRVLPKISHSINPCVRHGGALSKHLSTIRKRLPQAKNVSLLSFTNLISIESTYLADDSDINFFRIHSVLLKISHSITVCARHRGSPLKHLSTRTKLLPLPKNFSLLSFTNLIPFESTYIAIHSDINFFKIHCVLPKISHSITPCARHGRAPSQHLSTARKRFSLAKNFSLLIFTNLTPFERTYLADYIDINFFTIHYVLPKISHSLTPGALHGGAPLKHLLTTRKLLPIA